MNWKEISEKYPKAFWQLHKWLLDMPDEYDDDKDLFTFELFEQDFLTAGEDYPWHIRNLFDFFDENNLNIYIRPEYYTTGINWNWAVYSHKPKESDCFDGTGLYGDNGEFPTRPEAETAAFTKAFEILEDNES